MQKEFAISSSYFSLTMQYNIDRGNTYNSP